MELTEETFGKLQSRLNELEAQATAPLLEQASPRPFACSCTCRAANRRNAWETILHLL